MRIGSRGSALALAQTGQVARLLGDAEVVRIRTSGDRGGGGPTDKSRWVDAIEAALLAGEIDLAVHSAKDLPGELPHGLALLGTLTRVPAEDVLCGASGLDALAAGARVGTSSLRRRAQLLAARPDLDVVPLGGNVDTRLARLQAEPDLDAIVLARAGLLRLQRPEQETAATLEPARFVPSPGQGALALEGRADDEQVAAAVAKLTDRDAFACLRAERSLARALDAGCHTPLGAHARMVADSAVVGGAADVLGGTVGVASGGLDVAGGAADRPGAEAAGAAASLELHAWIGLPDGSRWIADRVLALEGESPEELGLRLAERMRSVGAAELLAEAEASAA